LLCLKFFAPICYHSQIAHLIRAVINLSLVAMIAHAKFGIPTQDKSYSVSMNTVMLYTAWLSIIHSGKKSQYLTLCRDKIVTGSFDKKAKIWDANTGQCYHTLKGHKMEIVCLSFDPHGMLVATGSMDNTAKLWDVETG